MMPQVISFHYTLTDKRGQLIDTSRNGKPLIFLEGAGQIIPGLEAILILLKTGDKKVTTVPYHEAYGPYDQSLIYKVERSQMPAQPVKLGDLYQIGKEGRQRLVTVVEVTESQVILDANHPLAGQDLTFDVEVMNVRLATQQEIDHGHVHGAQGHDHEK